MFARLEYALPGYHWQQAWPLDAVYRRHTHCVRNCGPYIYTLSVAGLCANNEVTATEINYTRLRKSKQRSYALVYSFNPLNTTPEIK